MEVYEDYIHLSKYSRYLPDKNRRETWEETVSRYVKFFRGHIPVEVMSDLTMLDLKAAIYNKEVMPSMRALMAAGPALERDHAAGYNCWAHAIDHPRVFDELFYLLMCGGGVGWSIERQYTNKMPTIAEEHHATETIINVRDSKIGWAKALKELIALLYNGDVPTWDLSSVRPAGARLRTFGGRASGPLPLDSLFSYCVNLFRSNRGVKLNSLQCHDLMCKICDTVIVGSVRRSAGISFSNLTDDRMRRAKGGQWWEWNPERALANNSTMYTEKPDLDSFMKEFRSMYKSKAGERGMVNQAALKEKALSCGREHDGSYLLNPCGEAILRDSGGCCNLTEVIVRADDTLDTLKEKIRYATILGTLQSTLTDFRYLRKVWKDNAEEERLLGVSLTGIMDHHWLSGRGVNTLYQVGDWLKELKEVAIETNKEWAEKLGIPASKQLTLVKPSGTVSQLCNCSSGIHPRYSSFYIRTVAQDDKDPLTQLMINQGVPYEFVGNKYYFKFPIKSPDGAVVQKDMGAIEQLELWKVYREHWCDGNPSQTIYYDDDSFLDVCNWVWKNWDIIGGLSFFPVSDHIYTNAPYTEVTEEVYSEAIAAFPTSVDWSLLSEFEFEDCTTSSQELSCAGGNCEI